LFTRTTTQLLESLRDPANAGLWQLFDQRYRPVIIAFAVRQGLSEDDASDVAQSTLAAFTADFQAGRYDRTRGRLSSWIIGIARNRLIDLIRSRRHERGNRGESAMIDLTDDHAAQREWAEARQRVIFQQALEVLRARSRLDPRTLQAFDLCAIRSVPPEAAAAECGMTVPEVYVAKNRAIKKLREIVAQLTLEFEEP
jgi:RNA polymerase sigma-70 factor (ECF subfamily)